MSGRPIIPPGKAGLVVLAAALAPVVLRKFKPFAAAVGKGLSKMGDQMVKMAEAPHDPVKTEKAEAPKEASAPRPKPASKRSAPAKKSKPKE